MRYVSGGLKIMRSWIDPRRGFWRRRWIWLKTKIQSYDFQVEPLQLSGDLPLFVSPFQCFFLCHQPKMPTNQPTACHRPTKTPLWDFAKRLERAAKLTRVGSGCQESSLAVVRRGDLVVVFLSLLKGLAASCRLLTFIAKKLKSCFWPMALSVTTQKTNVLESPKPNLLHRASVSGIFSWAMFCFQNHRWGRSFGANSMAFDEAMWAIPWLHQAKTSGPLHELTPRNALRGHRAIAQQSSRSLWSLSQHLMSQAPGMVNIWVVQWSPSVNEPSKIPKKAGLSQSTTWPFSWFCPLDQKWMTLGCVSRPFSERSSSDLAEKKVTCIKVNGFLLLNYFPFLQCLSCPSSKLGGSCPFWSSLKELWRWLICYVQSGESHWS